MPSVIDTEQDISAPSDRALVAMRASVDQAEEELEQRRTELAQGIQAAVSGGVSMAHVARVVGWSRQWCYNALSRWLPASPPDS